MENKIEKILIVALIVSFGLTILMSILPTNSFTECIFGICLLLNFLIVAVLCGISSNDLFYESENNDMLKKWFKEEWDS